ncbi:MAG: hypothetical protein QXZ70_07280 [Candidatus Bathyarchaeia archaeon]
MDKRTGLRIASITLFVHGFIEILGTLIMPFTPGEFLPTGFVEKSIFWVVVSAVYGVSRLIAGYTTWMMKKWGIAFGMALSITTMIVAPSIYPFGMMDLILAVITLASMLFALFGDERL